MESDTGGDAVRGTGARLRSARERKGLTVLQAAERLYVDTRLIEALEAEDFAALGAEVFVRGHLKRYAELVDESPAELQGLYASSTQSARPDLTHIPHANVAREGAPWRTPVLLGLGAFSLVAAVWWLLGLPVEKPRALDTPPAERAAGLTTGGVAGGSAEGAAAAGAAPQLALRFYALSWVDVSDASGRRLLQGLFAAGSERTVSGQAPLRIVLGNTPVVELKVNGQAVPLESLVGRDGTAHLLIDAQGRASQAPPRLAAGG
jgi:cytoskeleton protein RodZ